MDLSKYPEIEEVQEFINKITSSEWPRISEYSSIYEYEEKIRKFLVDDFKFWVDFKFVLKKEQFKFPIFRARALESFTNKDLITEHSYPPAKFTGLNRCNFPQHPVFYCSDNPFTALMEVIRNDEYKKKPFCLSKWELNENDDNILFETFLQSNLGKENPYEVLKKSKQNRLDEPFGFDFNEKQKEGFKLFLNFIHNSFIEDNTYHISSFLGHRSLYANHNASTDILMYPSVQTDRNGVNMAIHPNFVERRLKLKRLYIINLEDFDLSSGDVNISFTQYGTINRNRIIWKNINPNDSAYIDYLKLDFANLIDENFKGKFIKL